MLGFHEVYISFLLGVEWLDIDAKHCISGRFLTWG